MASIDSLLIKRLCYLEQINEMTDKYRQKTGFVVPNISGWEISEDYKTSMLKNFSADSYLNYDPIDYVYSYNITCSRRQEIVTRLGGHADTMPLIVPNNTIALTNTINFLSHLNISNVGLLLPCYFTVPNLLNNRKISFKSLPLLHLDTDYTLPREQIRKSNCQALILTSPVFSTGLYLNDNDIDFLSEYLKSGKYIISDESIAAPGKELIRKLGDSHRFVSIYSPHKFIHFNSFKFSCILYDERYEDFFDQWNDVYSGSLNITNMQAVHHYLSDNYMEMLENFYKFTDKNRQKLNELISVFPKFHTDSNTIGDYICLYNNEIPYKLGNRLNFIRNVLCNTNSIFYPGCLHGFQKEHGFVFRINLVSYSPIVGTALLKILDCLSEYNSLL